MSTPIDPATPSPPAAPSGNLPPAAPDPDAPHGENLDLEEDIAPNLGGEDQMQDA